MADKSKKNDVRQMRFLLERMADLAENAEHTGTFEEGTTLSVRRYNRIVETLQERDILPSDMFPKLGEHDTSVSTLGAECRLLKDYLEEYQNDGDDRDDEEREEPEEDDRSRGRRERREERRDRDERKEREKRGKSPEISVVAALAPFLEKNDLHKLLASHFPSGPREEEPEIEMRDTSLPTMKEIVHLAPFVEKATLVELLEAFLSRGGNVDSEQLIHLAPFLPRDSFRILLHRYFPHWFAKQESGAASETPTTGDRVVFEAQSFPDSETDV